ncbi:MAG: hypothetical protein QOE59_1017, partial [Actinomycetota bacterium]|nr:hypothetical protein [Actinomycetota bacterium]
SRPKHTKRQHTVEFSKDDHTRLATAVPDGVPRGDSHATRSDASTFPGVPVRLARWAATRGLGSRPVPLRRVFDCTRHPEGLGQPRPSALRASVPRGHEKLYAHRRRPPRRGPRTLHPTQAVARWSAPAGPGDAGYAPLASPRSSAGQSMGLLIPWSQVRVLPGAPSSVPPPKCGITDAGWDPARRAARVAGAARSASGDYGARRDPVPVPVPVRRCLPSRPPGIEHPHPAPRRSGAGGTRSTGPRSARTSEPARGPVARTRPRHRLSGQSH